MESDLQTFLRALFRLFVELRERAGVLGVAALGLVLAAAIAAGVLALRWINRGGLAPGATRRFFATRRETEHWSKTHRP